MGKKIFVGTGIAITNNGRRPRHLGQAIRQAADQPGRLSPCSWRYSHKASDAHDSPANRQEGTLGPGSEAKALVQVKREVATSTPGFIFFTNSRNLEISPFSHPKKQKIILYIYAGSPKAHKIGISVKEKNIFIYFFQAIWCSGEVLREKSPRQYP
jgi:hypothetical protein